MATDKFNSIIRVICGETAFNSFNSFAAFAASRFVVASWWSDGLADQSTARNPQRQPESTNTYMKFGENWDLTAS